MGSTVKDKEETPQAQKSEVPPAIQTKQTSEKVSLIDSGIFGITKSDKPAMPPAAITSQTTQAAPSPWMPKNPVKPDYGFTPFPEEKSQPKDLTPITPVISATPLDISYIDLSKVVVPKETLQKIPEKIARHYKAVPFEENENELSIAMIDPEDIEAKEIIKKFIQKDLVVYLASETDINHVLDQYQGLESEVQEAIKEVDEDREGPGEIEQDKAKAIADAATDSAPAARIVTSLIRRAIRDKASDIHIEPLEKEVRVRFRIDGLLYKKISLPQEIHHAVVSRIKILTNLKIDEQRLPQDGRFSIQIDSRKVDFRVSTMPAAFGENVVIRILDKATGILSIEQLGVAGSGLERLERNLEKSHGMILVAGPTGSGKTTTLYSLIDKLYSEGINIATLEDPIEYEMPGINQSQVNNDIGFTFAAGLRSLVRQDPDIIMIGEIRDRETAEMAVQSALTGHIVLSTLHTNQAAGVAPRLIDMGVEPFLLTSSLNVVVAQRLARKLCDDCKEITGIPQKEIDQVKEIIAAMPEKERTEYETKELTFYASKGCKTCGGTGFKRRIGIYEVLEVTEPVRNLVLSKASASQIQDQGIKEGMATMVQDGIMKALTGITSLQEVWRVIKD